MNNVIEKYGMSKEKYDELASSYLFSAARNQGKTFEEYVDGIIKNERQNPYANVPEENAANPTRWDATTEYEEEFYKTYYDNQTGC